MCLLRFTHIIQGGPKVGMQELYYILYILYTYFWPTLYITLIERKLSKPDDGRYRPKHAVFYR